MDVLAMVTTAINSVRASSPEEALAALAPNTLVEVSATQRSVIPSPPGSSDFCLAICEASHGTGGKAHDCSEACQNSYSALESAMRTYCLGRVCPCNQGESVTQTGLLELDEMTNEADSDHANLLQLRQKEVSMEEKTCTKKNIWCNGVCTTAVCSMSMVGTFKKCHESCMDPDSKFSQLVAGYCPV